MNSICRAARPLLAGLAILALAGGASAQQVKEKNFNVLGNWSMSPLSSHERPFWSETLPKASGGKLTAKFQPFNQLGLNANTVYDLVGKGVYDAGATVISYLSGDDPSVEGINLPGISDPAMARKIADSYRPQLERTLAKAYDVVLLAVVPQAPQVVFCNAKIGGLKDLAGKRVRGSGRMTMDFVQAVGGTGVSIAFNEMSIALERGVVDCGITGVLSGYTGGWAKVSSHFFPLLTGGWDHVGVTMNRKVWDGLDEPTRTLLRAQFKAFEDSVWNAMTTETEKGTSCNTGGACDRGPPAKMQLVKVSDADTKAAMDLLKTQVLPKWAARCSAACVTEWNNTVGKVIGFTLEKK